MQAVPLAVDFRVLEAKVGTQIDHAFPVPDQRWDDIHRGLMGQGSESQIEPRNESLDLSLLQEQVTSAFQRWMNLTRAFPDKLL
jgi:hypothetical protein